MTRLKIRTNPKLKNHVEFQKLFARWKKRNPLNDVETFNTRDFSAKQFFKPMELASIENLSITGASMYYRSIGKDIPSSETILDCCQKEGDERMGIHLNHALEDLFLDLPGKIRRKLRKSGIVIIDFHQDPYYGDPDNPNVRKIKTKHSTNLAYCYLTADLYTPAGKLTIAVNQHKPGVNIETVLFDLLTRIEFFLTPKLLILDGEFTNVRIMDRLKKIGTLFIGRKSISPRLKPLALAYSLTDEWEELRRWKAMTFRSHDRKVETTVHVTFQRVHNKMKAIVISPDLDISPDEADSLYGIRFNIETGYRDKHLFQARTTSKEMAVRFFILLFAIILWNICQMFLFIVSRGSTGHLNQVVKWRRELRTIKLFLLRDELL